MDETLRTERENRSDAAAGDAEANALRQVISDRPLGNGKIAPSPRLCACGCGEPIPGWYFPGAQYLRGHKAKRGAPGTVEVDTPQPGKSSVKVRGISERTKKPPNWPKLFHSFDRIASRWGAPQGLWELERDEVATLNDAWRELVEKGTEVLWLAKLLESFSLIMLALSVGAIFVPRIMITYSAIAAKGAEGRERAGEIREASGGAAGVARDNTETGLHIGQADSQVLEPWNRLEWSSGPAA